ncbi:uncharacterized protein LOC118429737 [Branchiostoma floridae]|uniref:Uncharacterized protein LOC118429737 n=1 Tax=Branchiostoma floridae TaxID=7739 RepID=A0A9J7M7J0_BRAFL|nr:uncharacterized protein LOC118429737 [Branchiostoma floridae]
MGPQSACGSPPEVTVKTTRPPARPAGLKVVVWWSSSPPLSTHSSSTASKPPTPPRPGSGWTISLLLLPSTVGATEACWAAVTSATGLPGNRTRFTERNVSRSALSSATTGTTTIALSSRTTSAR